MSDSKQQYVKISEPIKKWLTAGLSNPMDKASRDYIKSVVSGEKQMTVQMYKAVDSVCGRPDTWTTSIFRTPLEEELAKLDSCIITS